MRFQLDVNWKLFLLLTLLSFAIDIRGQETKTTKRLIGRDSISINKYTDIPEASDNCEPAVCQWWSELRKAANDVQSGSGRRSLKRYVNLFAVGLEKSYSVPLPDRPAQLLVSAGPIIRSPLGGPKRNGTIELSVEIRIDGSVGEVKIVKGLDKELDDNVANSVRSKSIYLPAIKDHAFVSETQSVKFSFWSQGGIGPKPADFHQ